MIPALGILEIGGRILDKVIPDTAARDAAKLELARLEQAGAFKQTDVLAASDAKQADVNAIEAQNPNLFVSGWRPATGWVCVGGLTYQVVVRPLISWVMENLYQWAPAPALETETLMTLLFGLLGLAGYRTIEKTKRVAQ